jgi:hypothetical protein
VLALWAKHHAIENESLFPSEKIGDANRAFFSFEGVIFGNFSAQWKGPPLGGNLLDMAPELNLFCKQGVSCLTIFTAFIGEAGSVFGCQFCSWSEGSLYCHSVLLVAKV